MNKNKNQYRSSVNTSYANLQTDLKTMQPGQWFTLESGARGQFLGVAPSGPVVNWSNGKFDKTHAQANKPLRQYAKLYAVA